MASCLRSWARLVEVGKTHERRIPGIGAESSIRGHTYLTETWSRLNFRCKSLAGGTFMSHSILEVKSLTRTVFSVLSLGFRGHGGSHRASEGHRPYRQPRFAPNLKLSQYRGPSVDLLCGRTSSGRCWAGSLHRPPHRNAIHWV